MIPNRKRNGYFFVSRCLAGWLCIATLLFMHAGAWAVSGITVTPASGGSAISADNAGTTWTALTGPTLTENNPGGIGTGTIILTIPSGFLLNTSNPVTASVSCSGSGSNMIVTSPVLSGNTITTTVTQISTGGRTCILTFGGIQVRPTAFTPLASGVITLSGTATVSPNPALTAAQYGQLTEVAGTNVAPTITKSVSPTSIPVNGTSTLTITITNPNGKQIVGLSFTDTYPANLKNASTPALGNTCGGSATGAANATSLSLSGGSLAAGASCAVSVSVTSATAGSYLNPPSSMSVTVTNAPAGNLAASAATLTVVNPPGVTKSFGTNPILAGGTSLLTITLSNSNAVAITGVAFTDTYPAGVTNSTTASTTCGGTATAAVTGGTVSLSGGSIPAGGNCTVTVTVTAASAGSYANSVAVSAVTSANAGSNTLAASDTLTVNVAVGAFDAYETATAPATATSGVIKTKIAGASFSLDIIALNAAKTVMQTGFTNVVKVELLGNNAGVSLDANGCPVTFALDQVVSPDPTLSNGRQTVTFAAVSNAWKDVRVKVSYPAVAPTVVSCSRDNFAIRPNTFTLSATDTDPQTAGATRTLANTTATIGNVHKAGTPFTIQAVAVNAAGTPATTTNYANSPTTTLSTCVGTACTASFGTLAVVTAFVSGTLTSNSATYTEVGSFGLTLQDQTFANVDAADSSTAERYITSPTINVGRFVPDHFALTTIGANAPALTNRSEVSPPCSPASVFTYMAEPMSISFQLMAQNASGTTTVNYAGALARLDLSLASSFAFGAIDSTLATPRTVSISALTQANPGNVTATGHGFSTGDKVFLSGVTGMTQVNNLTYMVTVVDANNFTIGTNTSGFFAYITGGTASRLSVPTVSGSWAAGVASVAATTQFERGANPDGPFSGLQIGIAPTDPDGIQLQSSAFNLDADASGTSERARLATTQMRFGRLRLLNAFGTTLLNLPLTLTTEYYDNLGSFFATNTLDNCTTIAANNIRMVFVAGTPNLIACETGLSPTGTVYFNGGKASAVAPPTAVSPLKLTLPGSGNDGAVDLTVNLNGASGGNTCTPSATAVTNAGKSWLQGNWGSGSYSDDPRGRATFGIFKNPDQFIYFRENF